MAIYVSTVECSTLIRLITQTTPFSSKQVKDFFTLTLKNQSFFRNSMNKNHLDNVDTVITLNVPNHKQNTSQNHYLILSNLRLILCASSSFPEEGKKKTKFSSKQKHGESFEFIWEVRKCWEEEEEEETNQSKDHKTLKPRFVYRPYEICHWRQRHGKRDDVYNRNERALSSPSFFCLWGNWRRRRR